MRNRKISPWTTSKKMWVRDTAKTNSRSRKIERNRERSTLLFAHSFALKVMHNRLHHRHQPTAQSLYKWWHIGGDEKKILFLFWIAKKRTERFIQTHPKHKLRTKSFSSSLFTHSYSVFIRIAIECRTVARQKRQRKWSLAITRKKKNDDTRASTWSTFDLHLSALYCNLISRI